MGNGYGAIYGSTWWGSQNSINFNEISYYIYAVDALKTRALADGAIMDHCVIPSNSVLSLPVILLLNNNEFGSVNEPDK